MSDSAEEMVNLPSKMQKQIAAAVKEASGGGTAVSSELFVTAEVITM